MNFTQTRACSNCPFRKVGGVVVRRGRVAEIAHPDNAFPCHKTVDYSHDDGGRTTEKSVWCAGKLAMLINADTWWQSQMLRVMARIGVFNPDNIGDRDQCFESESQMRRVHTASNAKTGDAT